MVSGDFIFVCVPHTKKYLKRNICDQGLTVPAESSLTEGSLSICWGVMAESLLLLTSRGVSRETTQRHLHVKHESDESYIQDD